MRWRGIFPGDANSTAFASSFGIDAGFANSDDQDNCDGDPDNCDVTDIPENTANDSSDNYILNTGTVNASATANATGQSIGIVLTGASIGDASATADAEVAGIAGADGIDTITNQGTVTAHGTSDVTARSTGFSIIGFTLSRADSIQV